MFTGTLLGGIPFYANGGFVGSHMPLIGFVIFAPEPLIDSARFMRLHDQIMRKVLRAVLHLHHRDTMPGHFKKGAANKYGYQARTAATQRIKASKFHHTVELVQRGHTQRSMLNRVAPVLIRGSASHILTGIMRFKFPFPVSRDATNPRHVTMAKMGQEIGSWTEPEKRNIIDKFAELYSSDLRYELSTRPKWRLEAAQAGFN